MSNRGVCLHEGGLPAETVLVGQGLRPAHEIGVDLDSRSLNAKSLAGCHYNSTVARAEIDQNVPSLDVRDIDHGIHYVRGGCDKGYISELPAILREEHGGYGESQFDCSERRASQVLGGQAAARVGGGVGDCSVGECGAVFRDLAGV